MADINVERKEGGSIWPWILGLLLLALLAWWFFSQRNDDRVDTRTTADTIVAPGVAPAGAVPATGDTATFR
ncbi:MAG: hypothetical protein M3409_10365 [Gemmatimonadota bacterium]|jgi:hypothetical protein|nr:hypothetical protein [Gemmatimonadota bacterium]